MKARHPELMQGTGPLQARLAAYTVRPTQPGHMQREEEELYGEGPSALVAIIVALVAEDEAR